MTVDELKQERKELKQEIKALKDTIEKLQEQGAEQGEERQPFLAGNCEVILQNESGKTIAMLGSIVTVSFDDRAIIFDTGSKIVWGK